MAILFRMQKTWEIVEMRPLRKPILTIRHELTPSQFEVLEQVAQAAGKTIEYCQDALIDQLEVDVDFYFSRHKEPRATFFQKVRCNQWVK